MRRTKLLPEIQRDFFHPHLVLTTTEIEKAKTRLKTSTVNKKNWDGAARMKVRSTQELQNSENSTLLVED